MEHPNDSVAKVDSNTISIPNYRLFSNYHQCMRDVMPYLRRCYESPINCYYLVAVPLCAKYEKNKALYTNKCLDLVRKSFKDPEDYVLTREVNATKVHVNVLIWTKEDVVKRFHQKVVGKYGYHVQVVPHISDRIRVMEYMFKEAKTRNFYKYIDYVYVQRMKSALEKYSREYRYRYVPIIRNDKESETR